MIPIKVTTTGNARSGVTFVKAVILVGGSANSTVVLDNSTDGSGDDFISLKALTNDSKTLFLGKLGVKFDTAIYATLSGAGASVYIYFE